jgi:thiamine-monophosphate kinase
MEKVTEIGFINKITENFRRSPLQRNEIHQTDAEIITIDDRPGKILAVTMDTISEEIKFGLYNDPFLIGWMTVIANMSDIAAVSATPIGILISEAFTCDLTQEYISEIQGGIESACRMCNTFVLGGDISIADHLALTGCAIGLLNEGSFLSRVGCKPGDLIYSTGHLGRGNGFALQIFNRLQDSVINYKPIARLTEGKNLLGLANCCMDTSDGAISTLDQIMNLNNCGIEIYDSWEKFIDEESKTVCEKLGVPTWFLLAGYHGEFELIFSVNPNSEPKLLEICKQNNWHPIKIGRVIHEPYLVLNLYGKEKHINSSLIRNLAFQHSSDIRSYLNSLFDYDEKLRKS